jgi:hypothetical protein
MEKREYPVMIDPHLIDHNANASVKPVVDAMEDTKPG